MMIAPRGSGRRLSLDEAAQRLGVEVAAVRAFLRMRLLREAGDDPPTVWESDVERLLRVLIGDPPEAQPAPSRGVRQNAAGAIRPLCGCATLLHG